MSVSNGVGTWKNEPVQLVMNILRLDQSRVCFYIFSFEENVGIRPSLQACVRLHAGAAARVLIPLGVHVPRAVNLRVSEQPACAHMLARAHEQVLLEEFGIR